MAEWVDLADPDDGKRAAVEIQVPLIRMLERGLDAKAPTLRFPLERMIHQS